MATGQIHKKKSKRVSCRRRYKIEKKVRDHKRKSTKEEKKKLKQSKSSLSKKPDVQIPNKCPFKADILREAEERKQRAEEVREKQKADRQKEIERRRNLSSLVKDAEKRGKEHEATQKLTDAASLKKGENAKEMDKSAMVSLKAFYSEVKKVIELSDVVLEVLDARDPIGSRCPSVEESVLTSGKRLVLLLNKIDLVPKSNVEKWLKYLRRQLPTIAFKASTQEQQRSLGRAGHAMVATSKCIGADLLMSLLGNYCRNKDIKTSIRVGIVGFPNVGKSSVVNSLKRKVACNVGATPGITRNIQEVHLDKKIRLLDSPGVVVATSAFDPVEMALKNAIRVECLDDPITAVEAVLRRCHKEALMLQYNLPDFDTTHEFLAMLAKKMGKLKRGGVPNVRMAAVKLLNDWNSGKLRYYTEPPEDEMDSSLGAEYISSELVTEMGKEFDLDAIDADQQLLLEGLPLDPLAENASAVLPAQPSNGADIELDDDDDNYVDDDDENSDGEMDVDTVAPSTKVKTDRPSRKSRGGSPERALEEEALMKVDGNRQSNKKLRKMMKKNKKKAKKTDKLATNLSDAMDQALAAFSVGSSSKKKSTNDDYDFDEHFD
jgi:nuclear GTP-binding protein